MPRADVTVMKTPAETGFGELFERLKGNLPGDVAVREEALAGFTALGLPHRRIEEFKYTDLRALMREAAPLAHRPDDATIAEASARPDAFAPVGAATVTFVNGHPAPFDASGLPAGVEVATLADAMATAHPLLAEIGRVANARDNPIVQLNTAFMSDGALLRVSGAVERPLHLRFVNTGTQSFATAARVVVAVEPGAVVTLIESHEGPDGVGYQPNTMLEMRVGDGARVDHVRLNTEGDAALALSTLTARLGADVTYRTMNAVAGPAVARHQVFLVFEGERSTGRIDGVSMLRGRQHADATLLVDHAVPNCLSRELFKTVLDDESIGVFQGKIVVRPYAQKTDGGMKSAALLLSDGATMNNKPELEIFADDVVCGHGATCGALDDELLFYLKSRGLPQADAESLLLQAFLGEAIEFVAHEGAREALIGVVEGWLNARR